MTATSPFAVQTSVKVKTTVRCSQTEPDPATAEPSSDAETELSHSSLPATPYSKPRTEASERHHVKPSLAAVARQGSSPSSASSIPWSVSRKGRSRSRTSMVDSFISDVARGVSTTGGNESSAASSAVGDAAGLTTFPPGSRRPARRRPNGYWNDLSRVKAALEEVNRLIPGRKSSLVVPTKNELKQLGREDIISGIMKHGGFRKVAAAIGWENMQKHKARSAAKKASPCPKASIPGTSTRSVVSSSVVCSRDVRNVQFNASKDISAMRGKVMRRQRDYWSDIERLKSAIVGFIDEFGTVGVMPTIREFDRHGQSALRHAAKRHGGLRAIAKELGLRYRRAPKEAKALHDEESFTAALLDYTAQHDPGVMPTAVELKAAGEGQLAQAISVHGGYPAVARRLGLIVRSGNEGAPQVWTEEKLAEKLRTFTATFYPALALSNCMPSESQLRKCGRNDLSYAISKFGGYKRVQETLGFQPRPTGPRMEL